jgi:L-aminopeptidase/D-esterase-like protein
VLCPQGAVAGVAQRGGAPGTRETDLLRPENTVQQVHALLLTGGSAFGLDAAGGVMRWLDEHGHGLAVGPARVPIVPAAVLFDLWVGDARIRPDASTGYAACQAASTQPPAQGNAGAGLGATVGKRLGIHRAMKGGIGTASLRVGGFTVAALVAVNAIGDVLGEGGEVLAGARSEGGRALLDDGLAAPLSTDDVPGSATTIGVVATDATLTKAQVTMLAQLAHHGLSRCVRPITPNDGDTLFALATATQAGSADLSALGAAAAEVVSRAIRNAVRAAQALAGPPALPAARDLQPRSFPPAKPR